MPKRTQKPTAKALEMLEERAYAAQAAYIRKRFGKEAAESANYGWGVEDWENGVIISTKVYGHGVLTTTGEIGLPLSHTFREF